MVNLINMNEVGITTKDNPIIGTTALATCFGILLYDEENKEAIVAHVSTNFMPIIFKIFDLIKVDKKRIFKYAIIPGYYSINSDPYQIKKRIENIFEDIQTNKTQFKKLENIPKNAIKKDKNTPSFEFAFDANEGKFVSQEVCFELGTNNVNNKSK